LKIEIHPRIPLSDGIDVAEQTATIYQVDPDDPENISRISYPTGDLIVKWELIPGKNGIIRSFFSRDNVNLLNGVSRSNPIRPVSSLISAR
jgi:hypothetical protein